MKLDPRLNAFRPDLADESLRGKVDAARFVAAKPRRVVAAVAPVKHQPRPDAPLDSEVLRGEVFRVLEDAGEGWSWGQLETDGYVGYVPTDALGDLSPAPGHRIVALRTYVYPAPDMKLPAVAALSFGALVTIAGTAETRETRYGLLANGEGAVVLAHTAPLEAPPAADFVAVAELFLNAAYLWGGRTSIGLDCSALVQLSLMAAGKTAVRDTDLQERMLGHELHGGLEAKPQRGDLVFWKGHVGILSAPDRIIHASGHHMTVVNEPLDYALARMGPPTRVRRVVA
jgi:cell wall-associated NlpC family hydrolase